MDPGMRRMWREQFDAEHDRGEPGQLVYNEDGSLNAYLRKARWRH